jgi:hypothetical protein
MEKGKSTHQCQTRISLRVGTPHIGGRGSEENKQRKDKQNQSKAQQKETTHCKAEWITATRRGEQS